MLWEAWNQTYSQWLTPEWFSRVAVDDWSINWREQLQRAEERRTAGELDPVERWIAADDGEVVGVAVASPASPRGKFEPARERALSIMYVAASHHGAGVAGELIALALPDGVPAELWVADPNPRAQSFYRKHGFEPDGARQINERLANIPEIRMVR